MKIGILTLPLHTNYGGILQAYALQTVLKRMGHEVYVFDIIEKPLPGILTKCIKYPYRFIKKYLLGHKEQIINIEEYSSEIRPIIHQNTTKFISKYIRFHKTDYFRDIHEGEFDAIIVGSDQIWRPISAQNLMDTITHSYLDFAEGWNIKRISYAASFGTDKWEYSNRQTKICKRLVSCFDGVSVREKSGIDLCSKYLGYNDAKYVLDPTLLLNDEDYDILYKNNSVKSPGNLMCYVLDDTSEKSLIISQVSNCLNKKVFRTNSKVENFYAPLEERIQPPVEQWLRGFRDADFVITDSFHACVFSIINKKDFIVIGNKERGLARFESLLGELGLSNRMISSSEDITDELLNQHIDFTSVEAKINALRTESFNYLSDKLS